MQQTAVLLGAEIALLVLGACRGVHIRKCSEGCPLPLICHEPTQQCWLPPDAGGGPDNLEGHDGGAGDAGAQSACPNGYSGTDSNCADINECAAGVSPCGAASIGCANTAGSYSCSCLGGFSAPAIGGTCADVDECARATDTCDHDPQACSNTLGSFSCACPSGFSGSGVGATGCLLTVPSLLLLVPSGGTLSPAFSALTTTYTLVLPPGVTSVFLTPSVSYPNHATINVAGETVTSGTKSASVKVGVAPRPVSITVTTEAGNAQTYVVLVRHSQPAYFKASNSEGAPTQKEVGDRFGSSVAISADGSILAVGACEEDSDATGVNGDQNNNNAKDSGAVYVYSRLGDVWTQTAYLKPQNAHAGACFGGAVSLSASGSILAVGATGDPSRATGVNGDQANSDALGSGAVYVFVLSGSGWTQQAYIKASNTDSGDLFGYAIQLSGDGAMLAVGAPFECSVATGVNGQQADNGAVLAGAVYVYVKNGMAWSQEAYLKASNSTANLGFGMALALSIDGATLAVGAPFESSSATGVAGGAKGSGAAYVFARSSGVWTQQAFVKASNAGESDSFGSVALSGDGSTLAVGAHCENSDAIGVNGSQSNNNALCSGAVYVFARSVWTWKQQAYIKASNTEALDHFGGVVALSRDGTTLAASASWEASAATGIDGDQASNTATQSGSVYLFGRAGTEWAQQAYVKATNTGAKDCFGGPSGYFAISNGFLALTADGSTLAVGAPGEASNAVGVDGDQANNSASWSGAVYVY